MAKTDEPEAPKGLIRPPRPALVYVHGAPWRWERSGALAAATMRVRGGRPGGAPVPEWQRAEPFRVPSQYSIPSVGPDWADVSLSAVARWGIAPALPCEGAATPVQFRATAAFAPRDAGDSRASKGRKVRWSADVEAEAARFVLRSFDRSPPAGAPSEASVKRAIRKTLKGRSLPSADAQARFQRAVDSWAERCAALAAQGIPAEFRPPHPSIVAARQSARLLDGIEETAGVRAPRVYREAVTVFSVFDPAEARMARLLADPEGPELAPHLPDVPHAPRAHSGIAGAAADCPWCGAFCRGVTVERAECPVMVTARDGAHGRAPNLETRSAILAALQAWKEERRTADAVREADAFILSMVQRCDRYADDAAAWGESEAVTHYDRLSGRWRTLADALHTSDGSGDALVADAVNAVIPTLPTKSRPVTWWVDMVRESHAVYRRAASLRLAAVTRIRAALDGAQVSPVVTELGAPKGAPMLRPDGTLRGTLVTPGDSGIAASTLDAGALYPRRGPRKARETPPDYRAPAPVQELRARPVYAPGTASSLPSVLGAPPAPPSSGPGFRGQGPFPAPEAPRWHWQTTPEAPPAAPTLDSPIARP